MVDGYPYLVKDSMTYVQAGVRYYRDKQVKNTLPCGCGCLSGSIDVEFD